MLLDKRCKNLSMRVKEILQFSSAQGVSAKSRSPNWRFTSIYQILPPVTHVKRRIMKNLWSSPSNKGDKHKLLSHQRSGFGARTKTPFNDVFNLIINHKPNSLLCLTVFYTKLNKI